MWGWAILAVVLGLLILPIGILADYNVKGFCAYLKIGPVPIQIYPRRNKSKINDSVRTSTTLKKQQPKENRGGKLSDFLPVLRTLLDFLGNLRKQIKVRDLRLRIILAGGDPCDLSINYGRTWAAIGSLQPQLDRLFKIKKQNIEVLCDYASDESTVTGHVELSIILLRLLVLTVRYGIRALKQYMSIKNQRKGGAGYEPKSSSNA